MSTTMTMSYFLIIPASESQVAKVSREQGESCVTGSKKITVAMFFFSKQSLYQKHYRMLSESFTYKR